jgi:hypothetical protein
MDDANVATNLGDVDDEGPIDQVAQDVETA